MSKALTQRPANPVARARVNALAARLAEIAEGDLETAAAATKALRLFSSLEEAQLFYLAVTRDPDPMARLEAVGFGSMEELRVAIHALKDGKSAPYALVMAQRRTELRWRDGQGESAGERAKGYAIPVKPKRKDDE